MNQAVKIMLYTYILKQIFSSQFVIKYCLMNHSKYNLSLKSSEEFIRVTSKEDRISCAKVHLYTKSCICAVSLAPRFCQDWWLTSASIAMPSPWTERPHWLQFNPSTLQIQIMSSSPRLDSAPWMMGPFGQLACWMPFLISWGLHSLLTLLKTFLFNRTLFF